MEEELSSNVLRNDHLLSKFEYRMKYSKKLTNNEYLKMLYNQYWEVRDRLYRFQIRLVLSPPNSEYNKLYASYVSFLEDDISSKLDEISIYTVETIC